MNWRPFQGHSFAPSIRTTLANLVVACVLPMAGVAAFLIFHFYNSQQVQLTASTISRARAMVSTVDQNFNSTVAALQALSTSRLLQTNRLEDFRSRAIEVLRDMRADSIVVVDMSGQLLLSTRQPFRAPLPKLRSAPVLKRILETGRPAVSDLYVGPVIGEPIYTVCVPVHRDGSIAALLCATARPPQLASILGDQHLPDSWRAVVVDSTGTVVVRTHEEAKFLGKKVNQDVLHRMSLLDEDGFDSTTLDGIPVLTVFSRSSATGWAVVLGIPRDELTAELRRTLMWLVVVSIAALAIGLLLAQVFGRRIVQSISALTKPARALGTGEPLTIPHLHFREANEVGGALLEAASTLHQSRHESHHDALTGLPNRALFQIVVKQQLTVCQRDKTGLAMLYIDLDGFKAVNDNMGHAEGDQLLRAVSMRLKAAIRDSDIAARIGGDEFAIALVHSDLDHAAAFADKLIKTISQPYLLSAGVAHISASIGVAAYPTTATDFDTLVRKADQAMYKAKSLGKGCYFAAKS